MCPPQHACHKYFMARHKGYSMTELVINHPQQYYSHSCKYHKQTTPQVRVAPNPSFHPIFAHESNAKQSTDQYRRPHRNSSPPSLLLFSSSSSAFFVGYFCFVFAVFSLFCLLLRGGEAPKETRSSSSLFSPCLWFESSSVSSLPTLHNDHPGAAAGNLRSAVLFRRPMASMWRMRLIVARARSRNTSWLSAKPERSVRRPLGHSFPCPLVGRRDKSSGRASQPNFLPPHTSTTHYRQLPTINACAPLRDPRRRSRR